MSATAARGQALPAGALRRFAAARAADTTADTIPARADPAAPVPLTPVQRRLWFLERAGMGGGTYLTWWADRLTGALDPAALATALHRVVERHEVLRTEVVERAGAGWQLATPTDALAGLLERVDLTVYPEPQREDAARSWLDAFVTRGFDLTRAPLLRAALVRLAPDQHVLALGAHHLICDGTGSEVIAEELYDGYRALVAGQPVPETPPAGVSFLDYAAWLADRDPAALAPSREYWRAHLAGVPTEPPLPTDRPRGTLRAARRGARHSVPLTPELTAAVRTAAQRERCTVFAVLTAALAAALVRFGIEQDVVVGAPASTRDRPELERTVGMFANTVALRTDLRGNPPLREVLRRAAAAASGALDHGAFPFEQVVELVEARRDLRRNPVFQAMLVVTPGGAPDRTVAPGLSRTGWQLPAPPARFDLTLVVTDGDPMTLHLDYAPDLFEAATVARFTEGIRRLLQALATDPDQRLGAVPVVPDIERSILAGTPPGPAPTPVLDRFAQYAAAAPHAPAVVTPDETVTYRELLDRSGALADELRAAGAGPGTPVAVVLPGGVAAVTAILAVLRAGGAYLPLDPSHPPARIEAILSEAGAPVIITSDGLRRRPATSGPDPGSLGRDAAYVVYTSGSTGQPKGVAINHATLDRLTDAFITGHGFGPGTRLLMLPPLTFDASVGDLFPALASGAALVLHPEPARLDGPELVRYCVNHQVTAVDTSVALWRRWVDDLTADPPPVSWPVTTMMVGGDRVPTAAVRAWVAATGGRVALYNHYGPTEATVCATTFQVGDHCASESGEHVPIGQPLPHVRAYVRDRYGGLAPVGVAGELYLGGDCLASGYLARPGLTGQRFRPDPDAPVPGARMYRTGDAARLRPDGQLEFLGRLDRQVKIHGHRIEPAEVEAALAAYPGVDDAAVAVRDGRLVGYLAGTGVGMDGLRAFLRRRLPDYLVPAAVVPLERLPRTNHGKIDESALPAPPAAGTGATAPPQGPVESTLAEIWAGALDLEPARIGRTDNFFDLGGHSLLAPGVLAEVQRRFGTTLPLPTLFETADLADLAATVAGETPRRAGAGRLDLAAEAVLPDDVRPPPGAPRAACPPRAVLVTGATGFLGAHLVAELLARTSATVYCLVRAGDPAEATQRVHAALHGQGRTAARHRVVGVPGDLTAARLGLDETTYAALADRVDLIVHNGGQVSFVEPYHRLRPANVDGTVEVLRLAVHGSGPGRGATPVHFVSTLGVFLTDRYRSGAVCEHSQPDDPAGLDDGYNQTKWVADTLVRRARDRGVPVSVHRPARIGVHSRTGHGNPDDWFSRLLATCVQVGLVPDLPYQEDISPVDYVAAGIAYLAGDADLPPGAAGDHHYYNHATLSYPELASALTDHGYRVALTDWNSWRAAVRQRLDSGQPVALAPFQGWLAHTETPQFLRPRFDCSGTEATLAAAGITCPPVDRELLGRQLDQLVAAGQLAVPGRNA